MTLGNMRRQGVRHLIAPASAPVVSWRRHGEEI
jgi:hypothetical protein